MDILKDTINKIKERLEEDNKRPLLVAIDGRCAAGKTTLAGKLADEFGCSVIHMDHFFLRPEQRTKERLAEPGGNVDYERFAEEVIGGLKAGEDFSYRIFDCRTMDFQGIEEVKMTPVIIVEGVYCCRSEFMSYWDMTMFLDIGKEEQMRRIIRRNGKEQAKQFEERWIPLEEQYFKYHQLLRQP